MFSSRSGGPVAAFRGRSIVLGRRTVAWLSTFAVATSALVGTTLLGHGTPAERLTLGAGSVWVVSPAEGLLTLLDGASEEVVASARVSGAGHDLGVVQAGTDAYVTDSTDGAVARIDGATFDVSEPVPFASGGGGVNVLSGGGELYVLDPAGARARLVDPRALQVRTDLSLAATPGPGQAVVDEDGQLWLIDQERGGLTWFDDAQARAARRRRPGRPARARPGQARARRHRAVASCRRSTRAVGRRRSPASTCATTTCGCSARRPVRSCTPRSRRPARS